MHKVLIAIAGFLVLSLTASGSGAAPTKIGAGLRHAAGVVNLGCTEACGATAPNRRQYYDEAAGKYYYYDSGTGRYFWEDGRPRS